MWWLLGAILVEEKKKKTWLQLGAILIKDEKRNT
jgi:hypothetical protein